VLRRRLLPHNLYLAGASKPNPLDSPSGLWSNFCHPSCRGKRFAPQKLTNVLPLKKEDWWLCANPDCTGRDRLYGLHARFLAHLWLAELRTDPVRAHALRDLVRSDIPIPRFQPGDGSLVRRMEELLATGRFNFNYNTKIVQYGAPLQESAPFPLAQRQSRDTSRAPAVSDPPSFPPDVDLPAQAAALLAAAASGAPFCLE